MYCCVAFVESALAVAFGRPFRASGAKRLATPRRNPPLLNSIVTVCLSRLFRIVFLRPGESRLVPGLLPVKQARQVVGGWGHFLTLPSLPSDRLQLASLPRRRR